MKTEALKQALDKYKFDAAIGGARRDEEKSRAKERIISYRNELHRWDPRDQRPELWNLFNCRLNPGESLRAFPLSNWTEFDIWEYIAAENIPIVPLYLAANRPIVERDGHPARRSVGSPPDKAAQSECSPPRCIPIYRTLSNSIAERHAGSHLG